MSKKITPNDALDLLNVATYVMAWVPLAGGTFRLAKGEAGVLCRVLRSQGTLAEFDIYADADDHDSLSLTFTRRE